MEFARQANNPPVCRLAAGLHALTKAETALRWPEANRLRATNCQPAWFTRACGFIIPLGMRRGGCQLGAHSNKYGFTFGGRCEDFAEIILAA